MGIFGNGNKKVLDIDVGLVISEHGFEPLDVEQWEKVVDKLWDNGVRHLVIISKYMSDTTMRVVKYAARFRGGLIVSASEITPEVAIDLVRSGAIGWMQLVVNSMGDKEVTGVKNALASSMDVIGIITTNPDIMERKAIFEHFGVENLVLVREKEYDVDMVIDPHGAIICNGREKGNILTEEWVDIVQQD